MKETRRTPKIRSSSREYDSLTTTVTQSAETMADLLELFRQGTVESDLELLEKQGDERQRERIEQIRAAMIAGDIRNAVWHALRAGEAHMKRVVDAWELDARIGREVREHGLARNPRKVPEAEVQEYRTRAEALWRGDSKRSARSIGEELEPLHGRPANVIRKRIADLNPNRRR